MKCLFLAVLLGCSLTAQAATDDGLDAALSAAIDNSGRSAASKTRDAARHPHDTLTFFGIKPGMTVVELAPGAGWYTEILAPYLRGQGRLIAASNDPKSSSERSRAAAARFQRKLDANPAAFDKVQLGAFEPPANIHYAPKGSVDLVLTFRNIHNWVPAETITALLGQDKWWAVPVATLLGIPMYADIFGTLPIAEALVAKGVGLGTVLAFMMAVTALSLPSLIMLKRVVKLPLLATFTGVVTVGILIIGFTFNALAGWFI